MILLYLQVYRDPKSTDLEGREFGERIIRKGFTESEVLVGPLGISRITSIFK